ncbi:MULTISPECIES: hypothetical protein [unclassified Pseudoalteromonas]|uniref:hypothetical protein n=1 Tax=unclassified Pseudoalteromonas TaxID=194690 RepID=UPI0003FB689D|nr:MULTISPECIES: hypothetical protein [unclassified Pseudoalteromonas]
MHYDVFNGDADGIIALLQLRLAEPKNSQLISGVKRNIKLLAQVAAAGDASSVTVLDISMEKNSSALNTLIENKVDLFYCDHHRAGDIPRSQYLDTLIDLAPETCTSLLINKKLKGRYIAWAICAAFGDNLLTTAQGLAAEQGYSQEECEYLKELGTLINYNGYGASLADLHIPPVTLYQQLLAFESPFDLRKDKNSPYFVLRHGYKKDYQHVATLTAIHDDATSSIFELPCEAWARRISGVFGNELANLAPSKAHSVLTLNVSGKNYTVSVRAPLANRTGADEVCTQFATGGGRKAAAGINALPLSEKAKFINTLNQFYGQKQERGFRSSGRR